MRTERIEAMSGGRGGEWWRSRWWMPAFSLFLGLLIFAAAAIGDQIGFGVFALALMAALGALFLFGGRSETLSGLAGPGRDERWASIDLRATAIAGMVLLVLLIAAWLTDLASGGDGMPYTWLLAASGVAYIGAVAWLRLRG